MSALQRFLAATSSTLPRQCVSGGILFATGDIIAQQLLEKRGTRHDPWRTFRLGLYGGAIFSPIAATWFGKVLERVQLKSNVANIAAKVALDQTVAAPVMTGLFFTATTIMAGGSVEDARRKLKESWWTTLKTGWAVWVPVQAVNMAIVPPSQRLLFVNVVSIFWNTFLSLVSSHSKTAADETVHHVVELVETKID
ncbi:Protein required for ethanol metabolism [Thecaphora frezii]